MSPLIPKTLKNQYLARVCEGISAVLNPQEIQELKIMSKI